MMQKTYKSALVQDRSMNLSSKIIVIIFSLSARIQPLTYTSREIDLTLAIMATVNLSTNSTISITWVTPIKITRISLQGIIILKLIITQILTKVLIISSPETVNPQTQTKITF
jgi:hypothetical protein